MGGNGGKWGEMGETGQFNHMSKCTTIASIRDIGNAQMDWTTNSTAPKNKLPYPTTNVTATAAEQRH